MKLILPTIIIALLLLTLDERYLATTILLAAIPFAIVTLFRKSSNQVKVKQSSSLQSQPQPQQEEEEKSDNSDSYIEESTELIAEEEEEQSNENSSQEVDSAEIEDVEQDAGADDEDIDAEAEAESEAKISKALKNITAEREAAINRKIEKVSSITKRHGVTLDLLTKRSTKKPLKRLAVESSHLLNLVLSAREDSGDDFFGRTKGTGTDLLIESLLRIQLQNRVCAIYSELKELAETSGSGWQSKVVERLKGEFGEVVIDNHLEALEQMFSLAQSGKKKKCQTELMLTSEEIY